MGSSVSEAGIDFQHHSVRIESDLRKWVRLRYFDKGKNDETKKDRQQYNKNCEQVDKHRPPTPAILPLSVVCDNLKAVVAQRRTVGDWLS